MARRSAWKSEKPRQALPRTDRKQAHQIHQTQTDRTTRNQTDRHRQTEPNATRRRCIRTDAD
eukprot:1721667-Lingulodinium_polyedra.AAC.1